MNKLGTSPHDALVECPRTLLAQGQKVVLLYFSIGIYVRKSLGCFVYFKRLGKCHQCPKKKNHIN